jgi:hypothetical protein
MNRCHQRLGDAKVAIQDFGNGCQAICSAARTRNDIRSVDQVIVRVNTVDEGRCVFARCRYQDFPCTSRLNVCFGKQAGREVPCAFDDNLDSYFGPRNLCDISGEKRCTRRPPSDRMWSLMGKTSKRPSTVSLATGPCVESWQISLMTSSMDAQV